VLDARNWHRSREPCGEEFARAKRNAGRLVAPHRRISHTTRTGHRRTDGEASVRAGPTTDEDRGAIDFIEHRDRMLNRMRSETAKWVQDHLNPEGDIFSTATRLHTSF
jgi:hypothetical protein